MRPCFAHVDQPTSLKRASVIQARASIKGTGVESAERKCGPQRTNFQRKSEHRCLEKFLNKVLSKLRQFVNIVKGKIMQNRNNTLVVEVKRLSPNATVPTCSHFGDAGLDLYASEDFFIKTGETAVVKTDLAVGLPVGFYGKVEDRSSLAALGLRTGAGVIDSGYTGEVKIVIHNINNTNDSSYRGQGYQIKKGQRIAQLIVQSVVPVRLVEVQTFDNSERGSNGFGSTGR